MIEKATDPAVVPIRWTSPEALLYRDWSQKSDVWSFGVLMYECYTAGATPFLGMKNTDVRTGRAVAIKMNPICLSSSVDLFFSSFFRPTHIHTFLADLPRSGFTAQVIVFMMDKCILPPPPGCPPEIYALMAKCWRFNAAKRIGFSKLLKSMAKTIKAAAKADALSGGEPLPPVPYKVVRPARNIALGCYCLTQQLTLRCMYGPFGKQSPARNCVGNRAE